MGSNDPLFQKTIRFISKMIFTFCALYFFIMGTSLIFFPNYLIKGFTQGYIDQTITGMLRGAGGSILPYSLLYILIALEPDKRGWALYVILVANIMAIILDSVSVITSEYKFSNTLIDLPCEILSIVGIVLIFWNIKLNNRSAAKAKENATICNGQ
jgi:hypothetical protein